MNIPSQNRKKGKTDLELHGCLRRLLGDSEDLRDRFTALRDSLHPPEEERAEISDVLIEAVRDYLDPMIEDLIGVVGNQAPRQSRSSAAHG